MTLSKTFSPTSIQVDETSTLTFTISNGPGSPAQSDIGFIDTLPTNLTINGTPPASQCGGTVSSTSGSITLSGGSLSLGVSSCTITATVTSSVEGSYLNDSSRISGASAGLDFSALSATLNVSSGVNVSGSVYEDGNHNGNRDADESGSGETLYVKLSSRSGASCSSPALQVATANSSSGAFDLAAVPPGDYCLILDANTTLSDTSATLPNGWLAIEPNDAQLAITVDASDSGGHDFGIYHGSIVSGRVFKDDGSGGGTPNDGIQNGGETGLAGVLVEATSGGGSRYDLRSSDGNGDYRLWLPAAATTVLIQENNPAGYLSTGGNAGTTGGNYDRSSDNTSFSHSSGSLYSGVTFADVPHNNFFSDNSGSGLPGTTLFYPHTFTAGSGGSVSFSTSTVASPSLSGWTELIYHDNNCNLEIDSGEGLIAASTVLSAGDSLCLLLKEVIPANAPTGATSNVTLSANFIWTNASPALSENTTVSDLTQVGTGSSSGLKLVKEVDKTSAKPGESLVYTIHYSNGSSEPLSNIVITDTIPAYTTSAGVCCVNPLSTCLGSTVTPYPDAISDCVSSLSGSALRWELSGDLAPGASGEVKFSVTIQP